MEASKRVVFVSLRGKEDGRQRTRRKRALGCVPIPAASPEPRRVSPTPTGLSIFPPASSRQPNEKFPHPRPTAAGPRRPLVRTRAARTHRTRAHGPTLTTPHLKPERHPTKQRVGERDVGRILRSHLHPPAAVEGPRGVPRVHDVAADLHGRAPGHRGSGGRGRRDRRRASGRRTRRKRRRRGKRAEHRLSLIHI